MDDLVTLANIPECEQWQPCGEMRWTVGAISHFKRLEQRWLVTKLVDGRAVSGRTVWREVPTRIVNEPYDPSEDAGEPV